MISNSAVSFAEGNLASGTRCTAFENWSKIVKTVVLPSEGGSPVTKGLLDTGKGSSRPAGGCLEDLFRVQTEHALMKFFRSFCIAGHQKGCLKRAALRQTAG